jgi:O-antigen ligase
MISSFNPVDESSSTHLAVALYALGLMARFPITGVGFGNFGYYYGSEVKASTTAMMSHNAILSAFAEAGILGGAALLALIVGLGRRPWRSLRRPGAAAARPWLRAATTGLFGAMIALLVSNLFYDYLLRDFVWVMCGLAVAAARLWEGEAAEAPRP